MDKDWQAFLAEIPSYGLPKDTQQRLIKAVEQKL
jgi:hypothetical protein